MGLYKVRSRQSSFASQKTKILWKLQRIEWRRNKFLRKIWIFRNWELVDLIRNLMKFLEGLLIREGILRAWLKSMGLSMWRVCCCMGHLELEKLWLLGKLLMLLIAKNQKLLMVLKFLINLLEDLKRKSGNCLNLPKKKWKKKAMSQIYMS